MAGRDLPPAPGKANRHVRGVCEPTEVGTSLRYDDSGGQHIQNWQTPRRAASCYRADRRRREVLSVSAHSSQQEPGLRHVRPEHP